MKTSVSGILSEDLLEQRDFEDSYDDVIPLEESDPELAKLLQEVIELNSKYPKDKMPILIDDDKVYLKNGIVSNKIDRNNPCPCGSGKKYKKCCGR
jgi:uncharacterized protein YecA (UPF0149 family)